MYWSVYNHLFPAKNGALMLFNAASGSFLSISAPQVIPPGITGGDAWPTAAPLGLTLQLIAAKALVHEGEDADVRDAVLLNRRLANLSERYFLLTVAPTLKCNFNCPYCFEGSHDGADMSDETADALIGFARRFQPGRIFAVTWFGGEPLLQFDRIRQLTGAFQKLEFKRYSASLITNGFCMNTEKCRQFRDLGIEEIQVTIDGPREIHDSRRVLRGGGGTFDRILSNLDRLAASGWQGRLQLRVNVDKSNADGFAELHALLTARYGAALPKLRIYPGIVHGAVSCSGCIPPQDAAETLFSTADEARFRIEQADSHGLGAGALFPGSPLFGCVAMRRNGYVAGPLGELYKCWNDVGIKAREVGDIFHPEHQTPLLAQWLERACAQNSPECRDCGFLPVCDGGCPAYRLQGGRQCSMFRDHLPELLEAYEQSKQKKNN